MTDSLITVEQATGSVLQELEDAFFDIPFENSDFQNRAFVIAAQQTPARAYRAIGLRMFSKIRALKEYEFGKRKTVIDIEEKRWKIADEATNQFDRRRLELEIEQLEDGQGFSEKLKNDALRELDCLYAEFKKLPKYNRAKFEVEEGIHFARKLDRQLQAPGAHESLAAMNVDLPAWDQIAAAAVKMLESKP
jgi:hypothetical protein